MSKSMTLLLTENVDTLGIIGDVVTVRSGYARNFLLPRGFVTEPSEEKIKALASRRAVAEATVAQERQQREKLVERLEGTSIEVVRSCNDLGMLYGSVTQQDVADALIKAGFGVKARDVRLPAAIKRVDHYDLVVKLASDLEASIKLNVKADRVLDREIRAQEDAARQAAYEAKKAAQMGGAPGNPGSQSVPAEASASNEAEIPGGGEKPKKAKKAKADA